LTTTRRRQKSFAGAFRLCGRGRQRKVDAGSIDLSSGAHRIGAWRMTGESPPRLVPDEQFPPYSYVTGRFPHPLGDPAGHSYGQPVQQPAAIEPANWRDSRAWLRAIDLFNHGFYWEAHEVWEGLWHAAGRRGPIADVLKGLIKLAAAGVKAREGRPLGTVRHALRALELFQTAADTYGPGRFLGLDIGQLMDFARELSEHPPAFTPTGAAVEVVFAFVLRVA
jgi:uncharacterized protein